MRALRFALPLATVLALGLLFPGCAAPPPQERASAATATLQAPVARREPHTTTLHGDTLVDDYYWLRNKGTPEVESYLHAERAYAEAFMEPTRALQQTIYEEMLSRVQQTDMDVPVFERGYWYITRTEEGKQYPIHSRARGTPEAPEEVILDLNQLAEGKAFLSVLDHRVSPDGRLLAYATDDSGFRQYTLQVKQLDSGALTPLQVPRVTSFEWSEDSRTLLYSVEHPQTKRSFQVYRHVLGEARHELLYEEQDERFNLDVRKSRDREMLFIQSASHTTSEVRYLPADETGIAPRLVAVREPGHEYYVDHRPGEFWIRTNDRGGNFRLVTAPGDDPSRGRWRERVPHREQVMLEGVELFRDFYVVLEREAGLPQLQVTTLADGRSHRIEFPEPAFDVWPESNREFDAPALRLSYQSPLTPRSIYDYDPAARTRELRKQVAVPGFDPARYRVELTEATASDGVKIPLWLLMRKDLPRDGRNPALLYAYGAYGSANTAYFDRTIFSLVDRGVVYAVAYVRGGGELGKSWHDDGRMLNKMNTFTDFIAAAEHLIGERYTSRQRLAISGASAGGLLMGAVTNMRPDLFRVVIAGVPFMEAINSMLDPTLPLTVGEFEEWGNPRIEAEYRYLRSYSPYDNLAAKDYPTMLVTSSYNDSQVMYWEPAKYVAKLRRLKTDRNPLLFYIDMQPAGHGGRSGRYDWLREQAFEYAFVLRQLGVE